MNLKLAAVIFLGLISSCSKAKDKTTISPDNYLERYEEISNRLLNNFVVDGWVVSRDANGQPDKLGDSLLWTGLAIGALDCEKASHLLQTLQKTSDATGGFWARYWPLPGEYQNNPISIDGEIGALWGIARHIQKCDSQVARDLWVRHARAVLDRENELYPDSGVKLVTGLDYPWRILSFNLNQTHEPAYAKRALFHNELVIWAKACVESRSACYRVHLAQLSILTAEILDRPITKLAKNNFCGATKDTDIPLTDWYCGRLDADQWLSSFELDKWEYRHQRCGQWEGPDLDPGEHSPAVDWLIMKEVASSSTRLSISESDIIKP